MNGNPTKIDMMNQSVRAVILFMLVGGFVTAFLAGIWTGKVYVSTEAYVGTLAAAVTYWFTRGGSQDPATKPTPPTTTEVKS